MGLRFFDTHSHLQDPRITPDLKVIMDRAHAAGVTHIVSCGTREEDWQTVLDLASLWPGTIPMLGLHPWFVPQAHPDWHLRLAQLLEAIPAGLGECGLDFAIPEADPPSQIQAFTTQMRLARKLNRPVSIHCRKAWQALEACLQETGIPEAGAIIHAFSGSAEMATALQKRGLHLAFGGSLTHLSHHRTAKALLAVAPDKLLLETDAPDIPPDGQDASEPAQLPHLAQQAAQLRSEPMDLLAEQVWINASTIFQGVMP